MRSRESRPYRLIVIGTSAGGIGALKALLGSLPASFPLPLLVVQHIAAAPDNGLARLLDGACALTVKEAEEREAIAPGVVYLAPPNYHLLVERDGTLALSTEAPVCYARPSIDLLFESAARAFGPGVIGAVLTGGNHDGSAGLKIIQDKGGTVIVQDPQDAEADSMPRAALAAVRADFVVSLQCLGELFQRLACQENRPCWPLA
jgi:two-component system chemotaxis response regulator CheB